MLINGAQTEGDLVAKRPIFIGKQHFDDSQAHKRIAGDELPYENDAPITAVSRAAGFIDIFCVGNHGIAVTAGFSPSGGWTGCRRLTATLPINPLESTPVTGGTEF